jgi:antitoxin FitA
LNLPSRANVYGTITALQDWALKARLKRLAERHGRSMEEEIREILRNAAKDSSCPSAKIGSRIAARFSGTGLMVDLPELRGQIARPADLKP